MKRPALDLVVVASKSHPHLLSLRLASSEDAASATALKRALVAAGFEAGDRVRLVMAPVEASSAAQQRKRP